MLQADDDFAFLDFDAAGEAIFLRVLVPLIEDIEFLVGWRIEIFHARGDFDGAGSTGAIKASGFHFDARQFPGVEEEGAGGNFGGLAAREKCYFRHEFNIGAAMSLV